MLAHLEERVEKRNRGLSRDDQEAGEPEQQNEGNDPIGPVVPREVHEFTEKVGRISNAHDRMASWAVASPARRPPASRLRLARQTGPLSSAGRDRGPGSPSRSA